MSTLKYPYYELKLTKRRKKLNWRSHPLLQKSIFSDICKRVKEVNHFCKQWRDSDIKTILKFVISMEYFGCIRNERLFFAAVDKILTQSVNECIYKKFLIENYVLSAMSCLDDIPDGQKEKVLLKYNIFLMEKVVKPIIRHFYHTYLGGRNGEVKFVPRNLWQSFQSTVQRLCIKTGKMERIDNSQVKIRGQLKFIPKDECKSSRYASILYHWFSN